MTIITGFCCIEEMIQLYISTLVEMEDFEATRSVFVGFGLTVFSTTGAFVNNAKQHKCEM